MELTIEDDIRYDIEDILYEWQGGVAGPEERAKIAHAIFERLQEGVVWEGEAIASPNDYSALREKHTVLRIIGHGAVAIRGEHFCEDGQRVQVTVRRKGGPPG